MTQPQTDYGQFIQRFLHLLQIMSWELEWQLQSKEPKSKIKKYAKNINWIFRDIKTSHPHFEAADDVFKILNSEHAKDLSLWFELGLKIENLGEIIPLIENMTKESH